MLLADLAAHSHLEKVPPRVQIHNQNNAIKVIINPNATKNQAQGQDQGIPESEPSLAGYAYSHTPSGTARNQNNLQVPGPRNNASSNILNTFSEVEVSQKTRLHVGD